MSKHLLLGSQMAHWVKAPAEQTQECEFHLQDPHKGEKQLHKVVPCLHIGNSMHTSTHASHKYIQTYAFKIKMNKIKSLRLGSTFHTLVQGIIFGYLLQEGSLWIKIWWSHLRKYWWGWRGKGTQYTWKYNQCIHYRMLHVGFSWNWEQGSHRIQEFHIMLD